MSKSRLNIEMKAMAPPVAEQLREQGLEIDWPEQWENRRMDIIRLKVHDLLTFEEYKRVRNRFCNRLAKRAYRIET